MRTPLPDRRPNVTVNVEWNGHVLQIQAFTGIMDRRDGCLQHAVTPNRNGSLGDHVMASKALPSPEVLRQLLRYDPDTGKLFWLPRAVDFFAGGGAGGAKVAAARWNKAYAGHETFRQRDTHGYPQGQILKSRHRAHRVIWAMQTGAWPEHEVDHVNGDRTDNRWQNLRLATHAENLRNMRRPSDNTSGAKGVSFKKDRGLWRAYITLNGRCRHLGYFANLTDASNAYAAASAELHGTFGRAS
jgi:hypothetical protein